MEQIATAGEDIVGFHPPYPASPSHPSKTDTQPAMWPGYSYVIVALNGHPYVGAWRWDKIDGFQGQRVTLVGDPTVDRTTEDL